MHEATAIDMHAHWMPRVVSDALRARTAPPYLRRQPGGPEVLTCRIGALPMPERFDDLPTRLAEMDRNGLSHGVLSLSTAYGLESLPLSEALPLCRAFNDAVSEACVDHPDRFSGLAALPTASLEAALAEFERAVDLPGMVGALLPGDGFLSLRTAERFRPIFEAADRRAAILLIHYGNVAGDQERGGLPVSDNALFRIGTLDMQARLSANMMTFCFTDFLEAYPNVTVVSHNLGGNIPFEIERMDHRAMMDVPGEELPSERFRRMRVFVDCNSLGARAIELAVGLYGSDKIVLGTDGSDFSANWSKKAIAEARITDAHRRAILAGNAARMLARVKARAAAPAMAEEAR